MVVPPQLAKLAHCVSWGSIWEWARSELGSAQDPVSDFLVGQFCEYLEILGFGRWAGFHPEDFEQFEAWSWEHQPILKARMVGAWEEVLARMDDADASQLGAIRPGNFPNGGTAAWAMTNGADKVVNLSLELTRSELQLNVVAWTAPQAFAFEKCIDSLEMAGLELVVFERRATTAGSGNTYWQRETHIELKRFDGEALRDGGFDRWQASWRNKSDQKWVKLAYHARYAWTRQEVLKRGDSIVNEIADRASAAMPALRQVNKWPAPKSAG